MAVPAVVTPSVLTNPGFLFGAVIGSTVPANTVVGGVFTDDWPAAWLPFGATEDGSELDYNTTVQPVKVAEFFDPISFATTERAGSFAFNLASWGLSNFKRSMNGGMAPLAPVSGTGGTALYTFTPPKPGQEVRTMIGWESLDHTLRVVVFQALQGGAIKIAFKKAPALAVIPCTWNMEIPAAGDPFQTWGAGSTRA